MNISTNWLTITVCGLLVLCGTLWLVIVLLSKITSGTDREVRVKICFLPWPRIEVHVGTRQTQAETAGVDGDATEDKTT